MLQDLRFGLKLLWKEKAFALTALLTLALCIGANTAIFTLLNSVVLRSLPYPDADRLVTMYNLYPGVGVSERGSNSAPDYIHRRKLTDVFSDVALVNGSGFDIGSDGNPQRVEGQRVTPSYFRVLRRRPLLGRTFTENEGAPGRDKVAVLSEGLWREIYGARRDVLGEDIRLSGVSHEIVGVMPEGYGIFGDERRIWVPEALTSEQTADDRLHSNNWGMVAQLKPGVSIVQARQRIDALNRANLDRVPKYRDLIISAGFHTRVVGLKDELVRDVRPTLYLLQIAVVGVLLIGCVNLANLMLVRSNVRMKELAIRSSIGASRWRLSRQLLTESVTVALVGGVLGLTVAYGGVHLLSMLGANELPRGQDIRIDTGILAFTAVVALLTGLLFGSIPIAQLLRRNLTDVFRDHDRTGTLSRRARWFRSSLVVCQVSLAFMMLIGSGLLTLSFSRLLKVNPGFTPDRVTSARFSLPSSRYQEDPAVRAFITSFLDRLRQVPGIRSVGITTFLPFSNNSNASVIAIEGRPLSPSEMPPVPGWNIVNRGYRETMSIPLLQGRDFAETDTETSGNVVVIDEFLARKYWPNGDAIGHNIRRGIDADDPPHRIIGVVGSVTTLNLADKSPVGQIYFHYKQVVPRTMHLVARSNRDSPQVIGALRGALTQIDPELPLFNVNTMPERIARSLLDRRAAMALCLIFGGVALFLAAVGVYGVLAYSVTQRTREIGIRMALGADVRKIVGMVVGYGLRLAATGLVIGIAGALVLTRLMTSLLFDVEPTNAAVFLAGCATLGVSH
ncbi:MAG: FtsX-like permease family protein [Luteitalea sp.]|nr:FtsX-like permease family protein [Luteitalea sp.]